jgi:putative ABC transport system permease protein
VLQVTPGLFKTLGISVIEGRTFENRDAAGAVVISESTARQYWEMGGAVGRRIRLNEEWETVVGVVKDVRYRGVDREPVQIYLPYAGGSYSGSMDVVVRSQKDPRAIAASVQRLIASMDPEVTVYGIMSLENRLWTSISEPGFRTLLLGIFALASLVLSVVGAYGVMSYMVARRTREVGIRMALGADAGRIVQHIIGRGLFLTVCGLSLGLFCAYGAVGVLKGYLFNIEPSDSVTFMLGTIVLAAAALLACWIPARRAARVDPLVALRAE